MQKDGSFCIIICNNKILLFHRDNNPHISSPDHWQLPGGGLEQGETFLDAIKRELVEEVSCCPENLHYIGMRRKDDGSKTAYYMTYVDNKSLFKHGKGEGQGIDFFTIDEAKNLKLTPGLYKSLHDYENILRKHIQARTLITATEIGLENE